MCLPEIFRRSVYPAVHLPILLLTGYGMQGRDGGQMKMKRKGKLALVTAMGILLNILTPQPVCADYFTSDLQRLHWLCSDYQLPVRGYVIEGWFALEDKAGVQRVLQEQLHLKMGQRQGNLLDGSALNTSVMRRGQKLYVELQLITEQIDTAQHYYALWQSFADCYQPTRPVGVTVITQLPEVLDDSAQAQLTGELQHSLSVEEGLVQLDSVRQIAGYSPQLQHRLDIGGQLVNYNLAFRQNEQGTVLYLATPVIYQQY